MVSRVWPAYVYRPPKLGVAHTAIVRVVCASETGCGPAGAGGTSSAVLQLAPRDLPHNGGSLSLHLFFDQAITEAYWQGGRVVSSVATPFYLLQKPRLSLSAHTMIETGTNPATGRAAVGGVNVTVNRVQAWRVGGIWVGTEHILRNRGGTDDSFVKRVSQL